MPVLNQVSISYIKETLDWSSVTEENIRRIASLKVAMKQLAAETRSTAIAIQCWSTLQDIIGIISCLVNAILTDEKIPVTCETDIHGAITSTWYSR